MQLKNNQIGSVINITYVNSCTERLYTHVISIKSLPLSLLRTYFSYICFLLVSVSVFPTFLLFCLLSYAIVSVCHWLSAYIFLPLLCFLPLEILKHELFPKLAFFFSAIFFNALYLSFPPPPFSLPYDSIFRVCVSNQFSLIRSYILRLGLSLFLSQEQLFLPHGTASQPKQLPQHLSHLSLAFLIAIDNEDMFIDGLVDTSCIHLYIHDFFLIYIRHWFIHLCIK